MRVDCWWTVARWYWSYRRNIVRGHKTSLRTVELVRTDFFSPYISTFFSGARRSLLALLAAGHARGSSVFATHASAPADLRGMCYGRSQSRSYIFYGIALFLAELCGIYGNPLKKTGSF